jgi:DNA invertase Pin-like site-specific DNA recombinase
MPAPRKLTSEPRPAAVRLGTRNDNPKRFVAYYRVSTVRQEASGLGLEAQRAAVRDYLAANPGQLIGEFAETISGLKTHRPRLDEAIHLCRIMRAVLVIARLDRLARNVSLVSSLVESGLDFVAVDFPHANRFTVHVLAALAEYESKLLSERMKGAIAASRARGFIPRKPPSKRGLPMPAACNAARNTSQRAKAAARARDLAPLIWPLIAEGKSYREIGEELNCRGIATPRCQPRGFTASAVAPLIRRTKAEFGAAIIAAAPPHNRVGKARSGRLLSEVSALLIEMHARQVSYVDMAAELDRRGIKAPRGGPWHATTLWRYLTFAHGVASMRKLKPATK